jgi:aminoacrylate hydrolase
VGEEDVLTPPWYSRQLAEHIPNTQLAIIPAAGHALPIERPTIFNMMALAFLQEAAA